MKKIILLAMLAFGSLTQAQVITATGNGEPITEGQTFTFDTHAQSTATLGLLATNITNAPVYIKLKVNSITNADGSEVQFCFGGQCYLSVSQNATVPSNTQLAPIAPNETNNTEDHFWNNNTGITAGEAVIYNLSFIQVDEAGTEMSTLLTFNYKYQPTVGLTDFNALQNIGITVKNTVVKSQLELNANVNASLQVVNVNGQTVKTVAIANGAQNVDLSALSNGVYFARFTTTDNKTSQIKIVKN
jgi:hypothetical protein